MKYGIMTCLAAGLLLAAAAWAGTIQSGHEYRLSFYQAKIFPGGYSEDDSSPAPDAYIQVVDRSGNELFSTGEAFLKGNRFVTLLANRNTYQPDFKGVGFTFYFTPGSKIAMSLMDWDGLEGLWGKDRSRDDRIGSPYPLEPGLPTGIHWIRGTGWEMRLEIVEIQ